MKYAFYIILHPFDGFWDLKYHKKNSFAAANIILLLFCIVYVLKATLTSYLFGYDNPELVNVFTKILSVVVPIAVWSVLNWSLSTLFDGKATMKQIWIQTIYSLVPVLLINIPLIILSYVLSGEEAMFYTVLSNVGVYWALALIVIGNMEIQDYTIGKTIIISIFTLLGILAVIFIGVIIFSTLQQLVSFVTTVFLEFKYGR